MNEFMQKLVHMKSGSDYDVAVMYSGGKDSAYLLYLLKEIYHMRVIAVMVDNGFEHDYTWVPMQNFTKLLGIPLVIIHPDKEMFALLFRTLIVEHEKFQREGVNHVCFICNSILWCCVAQFAKENNIPYVASGLSLAQLNSGRSKPLHTNDLANSIAERSARMIYKNALDGIKQTKAYSENVLFRDFFDGFGESIKSVTTIYPYIYHAVSVQAQKQCLEKLNWQPPSLVNREEYISSGCRIMRGVVYELEKIGIITLNEREQAKSMMERGLMDNKQKEFAEKDVSKELVHLDTKEIEELQVADYLEKLCKELGKIYKR